MRQFSADKHFMNDPNTINTGDAKNINLVESLSRNTFVSIFAQMMNIFIKAIMIPISIHYLGVAGFGIWSIITNVQNYFSLGGGGIGSAFQKYVAEATGTGDYDRASRLLSSGSIGVLSLSLLVLGPAIIFVRPLSEVLHVTPAYITQFSACVIIIAVTMIIFNFMGIYGAITMGSHRIEIVKIIDIINHVIYAVLAIVFLVMGFGLVGMTLALSISYIIRAIMYFIVSRVVLPEVKMTPKMASFESFKEIIAFTGTYQMLNYFEIIYFSLLPFLILRFFNAELLGIYAIAARIVSMINILANSLLNPLVSGSAWVYSTGRLQEFNRLITKSVKFNITLLIPLMVFVTLNNQEIFLGLMGELVKPQYLTLILVCFADFFKATTRVFVIMYRSTGGLDKDIKWIVMKIVLLSAGFYAGQAMYGFHAGLAAFVVTEVFGFTYMVREMVGIVGDLELKSMFRDLSLIIIVSIVIGLVLWFGKSFLQFTIETRIDGLLHSVLDFSVFGIIFTAALYLSNFFTGKEKQAINSMFVKVVSFIPHRT